ncbi:MAG: hypothetical protein AAF800_06060 [Planctomycetota bacterium]
MNLLTQPSRCLTATWAVAVAGCAAGATAQDFTWTGAAGDGLWLTPGNWTPTGVPDLGGETATVGVAPPARLTGDASVDGLTVTAAGGVTVAAGGRLNLLGGSATVNDGQITLTHDNPSLTAGTLVLQTDLLLGGTGRLTLDGADTSVRQGGPTNQLFRLTVGSDQTVNGHGLLGTDSVLLSNDGLIDADTNGQTLRVNPGSGTDSLVNSSLMRARNGGTLELSGAGGGSFFNLETIQAVDGSVVLLTDNPSLSGGSGTGTLTTTGTGVVRLADNDSAFLFGQVIDGRFEIGDGADLSLGGSVTAEGQLIARDASGGAASTLDLLGDFDANGLVVADAGGTLNVGLTDTAATLNNRGTFRADKGSQLTLDLGGTLDQRGAFEAVNGGTLTVVSGTPVRQFDTTGGIDAVTGGTFRADNGTLDVAPNGFDLVVNDRASLAFHGNAADTNLFNDAAGTPGSLVSDAFDTNAGSFSLTGGTDLTTRLTGPFDFTNAGTLTVGAGSTFSVVDGNGDRRNLNSDQGSPSVIRGDGTIFADVFNGFTGEIRPDLTAPGSSGFATLTIDGDLLLTDESQSGSGGVYLDTAANGPGIDTLVVTGTATLAGALYIDSVPTLFPVGPFGTLSAGPATPQEFLILDAGSIVGGFDLISLNGDTSFTTRIDFANGQVFLVIPEPTGLALLLAATPWWARRARRTTG